jgi:D12 class N6 adenine-specific DNA methyltransferase
MRSDVQFTKEPRGTYLQIRYNKIKRVVKGRPLTLELFGFHIGNKLIANPAYAIPGIHNSSIPMCYPFLKWAGGKRQIISHLRALAPPKFVRNIDPFLGGGAMFLDLTSDKSRQFSAYISDINPELINVYVVIKDNVEQLIKLLAEHEIG